MAWEGRGVVDVANRRSCPSQCLTVALYRNTTVLSWCLVVRAQHARLYGWDTGALCWCSLAVNGCVGRKIEVTNFNFLVPSSKRCPRHKPCLSYPRYATGLYSTLNVSCSDSNCHIWIQINAAVVFQLVNLLANDGQRLADMMIYISIVIGAPVMILVATIFSCIYLGWTAIIGIVVFLSFVPIQVSIGITQKNS